MSLAGECSPLPASGPQSQPLTLPRFYPAPCVASRVMASLSEATVTKQNNNGGRWPKTPAPVPTQSVRDPPKADTQLLEKERLWVPTDGGCCTPATPEFLENPVQLQGETARRPAACASKTCGADRPRPSLVLVNGRLGFLHRHRLFPYAALARFRHEEQAEHEADRRHRDRVDQCIGKAARRRVSSR